MSGVFAPISEGTVIRTIQPRIQRVSSDMQRIVHREKIATITTNTVGTFAVLNTYALNPGLSSSFPWLSNEALGWEQYRFNRVRFIFVPGSPTTSVGNLIMGPDYDSSDPAPVGETQFSSYKDVEEANVYLRFHTELTPSRMLGGVREKYIRSGSLSSSQDVKLYDSGNFFVACTGTTVANSGKLWVEYDVTLINPQVPAGGFPASATIQGGGTLNFVNPFGTAPVFTGNVQAGVISGNVIQVQGALPGTEVSVDFTFQGTTITNCAFGAATGATLVTTKSSVCINAAATQASCSATYLISSEAWTLPVNINGATNTGSQCIITVLTPRPAF